MTEPQSKKPPGLTRPSVDDREAFDKHLAGIIERSADRVHAEQARLRALGIIDDQGNLLQPLSPSPGGQGDPGEW